MPTSRSRIARRPIVTPYRAALLCRAVLLVGLGGAGVLAAASEGSAAAPNGDVEPVGEWLRFAEVGWRERPIRLHLRTGYARPVILPEPVTRTDAATRPECTVSIDVDVVLFEPATHFKGCRVELVGTESGRPYRFDVRADASGKRIPLRVRPPR